jgi:hypothetical protein
MPLLTRIVLGIDFEVAPLVYHQTNLLFNITSAFKALIVLMRDYLSSDPTHDNCYWIKSPMTMHGHACPSVTIIGGLWPCMNPNATFMVMDVQPGVCSP